MSLILVTVASPGHDSMESFSRALAEGDCLCAEVDPSDRPCLTCDAKTVLGMAGNDNRGAP